MNIWRVLASLPRVVSDVQDLANRVAQLKSDPAVVKAIEDNPDLKELSDSISRDVRDIQEAFK